MQLPTELTDEMHQAIQECLRIAAARGRALRLEREKLEAAKRDAPKDEGRGE